MNSEERFEEWFGRNTKRMIAVVDEKSEHIYENYKVLLYEVYVLGLKEGRKE